MIQLIILVVKKYNSTASILNNKAELQRLTYATPLMFKIYDYRFRNT